MFNLQPSERVKINKSLKQTTADTANKFSLQGLRAGYIHFNLPCEWCRLLLAARRKREREWPGLHHHRHRQEERKSESPSSTCMQSRTCRDVRPCRVHTHCVFIRQRAPLPANEPTRYFMTSRDVISSVSGKREAALRCFFDAYRYDRHTLTAKSQGQHLQKKLSDGTE